MSVKDDARRVRKGNGKLEDGGSASDAYAQIWEF